MIPHSPREWNNDYWGPRPPASAYRAYAHRTVWQRFVHWLGEIVR